MNKSAIETDPVPGDSYAGTWMNYDDGKGNVYKFKAGDVVRSVTLYAFSDAVVAGFDNKGNARLLRPYLYASLVGTTSPNGLTGYEVIDRVTPESLSKYWLKVGEGRTT
jgi:hypothetical protein